MNMLLCLPISLGYGVSSELLRCSSGSVSKMRLPFELGDLVKQVSPCGQHSVTQLKAWSPQRTGSAVKEWVLWRWDVDLNTPLPLSQTMFTSQFDFQHGSWVYWFYFFGECWLKLMAFRSLPDLLPRYHRLKQGHRWNAEHRFKIISQ